MEFIEVSTSEQLKASDHYISNHPQGHPMQTSSWGLFKAKHGWKVRFFQLIDEKNNIMGTVTALEKQKMGVKILYIPRGPVWTNMESCKIILNKLKSLAKEYFFIRVSPFHDISNTRLIELLSIERFQLSKKQLQTKGTIVVDISGSEETILQSFHPKTRYNVKLAEKHQVKIEKIDTGKLDIFYELMLKMTKRQDYALHDKNYYLDLIENHSDIVDFYLASYNDSYIGTLVILHHAHRSFYLYGAYDYDYRKYMGNYLMHWQVIKDAKARGDVQYDLQGVPLNVTETHPMYNFYRFKKGFSDKHVEFIGEFDYSIHPFLYSLWNNYRSKNDIYLIN